MAGTRHLVSHLPDDIKHSESISGTNQYARTANGYTAAGTPSIESLLSLRWLPICVMVAQFLGGSEPCTARAAGSYAGVQFAVGCDGKTGKKCLKTVIVFSGVVFNCFDQ